jgi:Raf kinase inhibitor-like YbhB/YbcL family protein
MELKSSAITPGGTIPTAHTCEGENLSPPFEWAGLPEGTVTLLLICDDPDAPRGTFRHWAAYNIPASATGLAAGEAVPATAVNDFGKPGWAGPCPPRGHGPHRYIFRLAALKGRLEAPAGARCAEIQRLAEPLELGHAELTGSFGR